MVRISRYAAKYACGGWPIFEARGHTRRKTSQSPTVDSWQRGSRISRSSVWMDWDTSPRFSTESPVTPQQYALDRWTVSERTIRLCTARPGLVHRGDTAYPTSR
jgi:hypothetical protein